MANLSKVLIADNLSDAGVEILKNSGVCEVDYREKTPREELLDIIGDYEGLIIRSASKVDQEVLEKASKLRVVIRAGVGVDNIDIQACSQQGIVVMNAPAGNSVATAEQALALMFGLARNTPQAYASMKQKKWEKSKFKGIELTGKKLGVVGLGRIGKEVVKRAKGLQMEVIGYDPYIPRENLEYLQIQLVSLDKLLEDSDFITVHTPLTDATKGLVNKDNLSKLKKGVRLVNAARGGIYDEDALAEGLSSGVLGGVGLDVYTQEPPPEDFALYDHEECIMTPHLGASTSEAQIEVAKESAQSMVDFFKEGISRNSLNFPTLDPKEMDVLQPWFELSERLGSFAAQALEGGVQSIEMQYQGELAELNLQPLEIAMQKGVLSVALGDEVNLVNAPILAKDRSIQVSGKAAPGTDSHSASAIKVHARSSKESMQILATVNFSGGTIIGLNNLALEFKPEGHLLYLHNKDVPRVVAELGNTLGESNINIAALQLSRESKGGAVTTIIQVDDEVPTQVLDEIRSKEFILQLKYIRVI